MHISQLAKRHGLTRGSLLHYDRLRLLKPSGRTQARYRQYTEADEARLEKICLLRKAGLSLKHIAEILEGSDELLAPALELRLAELEREMEALRTQQRLVVSLLRRSPERLGAPGFDWAAWVAHVKSAGLTLEEMRDWHAHFERLSPEKHRRFLQQLQIPAEALAALERWGVLKP